MEMKKNERQRKFKVMLWLSVAKLKKVHNHKTRQKLVATDARKQNSFLKPPSLAASAPRWAAVH